MEKIPIKLHITPAEIAECEKVLGTKDVDPVEFIKAMWQLGTARAQKIIETFGQSMGDVWLEKEEGRIYLVIDGERTDVAEIEMIH